VIDPSPAPPGRPLDRAAHHRTDDAWIAAAWPRARVMVLDMTSPYTGHALVGADGALVLLDPDDPAVTSTDPSQRYFLGVDDDGTPYFAAVGPLPDLPGTRAVTTRDIGHALDARDGGILVTAVALGNWHGRHGFSPETGAPMVSGESGWSRVGPDGRQQWPRTDPAVIMLVHDGVPGPDGRCLLGHNAAWKPQPGQVRRYSCLAGFVEPGESAEAAVEREVCEEVGVRVSDVRYAASQPWPYPGSLMLGFYALADPDEPLRLDPAEIAAARWFTRSEILDALATMDAFDGADVADEPAPEPVEPGLPMRASIAYRLIKGWATV
jgi:NAD+ diphosphatase